MINTSLWRQLAVTAGRISTILGHFGPVSSKFTRNPRALNLITTIKFTFLSTVQFIALVKLILEWWNEIVESLCDHVFTDFQLTTSLIHFWYTFARPISIKVSFLCKEKHVTELTLSALSIGPPQATNKYTDYPVLPTNEKRRWWIRKKSKGFVSLYLTYVK